MIVIQIAGSNWPRYCKILGEIELFMVYSLVDGHFASSNFTKIWYWIYFADSFNNTYDASTTKRLPNDNMFVHNSTDTMSIKHVCVYFFFFYCVQYCVSNVFEINNHFQFHSFDM